MSTPKSSCSACTRVGTLSVTRAALRFPIAAAPPPATSARPHGAAAACSCLSSGGVSTSLPAISGAAHRRSSTVCASSSSSAGAAAFTQADEGISCATAGQLPRTPAAMVDQAAAAVQTALDAGVLRQTVTFLLPVNEKEAEFNNTEPIDYPCSLQKEFDTACSLVKGLLQRLLGADTTIAAKRIDDGGVEGEPCAVLFPEDKSFLTVVFPTAYRLKQLQAYAKTQGRPLLIVNPQWRNEGQVISDFGFGPWKKAAEDFLSTFQPTYFLREKRIGSPGTIDAATGTRFVSGGVVRVLRQYPGQYQSHAMAANGSSQLMDVTEAEPSYQDLDAMIKRGRQAGLEIFKIAQQVTAVYSPAENGGIGGTAGMGGGGTGSTAGDGGTGSTASGCDGTDSSLSALSDADIEAMDAASLRRMLLARGQPASGRIAKLRERLRELRDQGK